MGKNLPKRRYAANGGNKRVGGFQTPVVMDGEVQFDSIKEAAAFAYHQGWGVSMENAYHKMKRAVQGVDHMLYGHEWKKGWILDGEDE